MAKKKELKDKKVTKDKKVEKDKKVKKDKKVSKAKTTSKEKKPKKGKKTLTPAEERRIAERKKEIEEFKKTKLEEKLKEKQKKLDIKNAEAERKEKIKLREQEKWDAAIVQYSCKKSITAASDLIVNVGDIVDFIREEENPDREGQILVRYLYSDGKERRMDSGEFYRVFKKLKVSLETKSVYVKEDSGGGFGSGGFEDF